MTTRHGVSPLHLAVKEGDIQIVDTLLEHGASPSLQTTVSARMRSFTCKIFMFWIRIDRFRMT